MDCFPSLLINSYSESYEINIFLLTYTIQNYLELTKKYEALILRILSLILTVFCEFLNYVTVEVYRIIIIVLRNNFDRYMKFNNTRAIDVEINL